MNSCEVNYQIFSLLAAQVYKYLVLADGVVTKQKFFTAADFQHVTSDVHRHTFLLLFSRDVHRSNLSSDRFCDYVLGCSIIRHLHRNLAAFTR